MSRPIGISSHYVPPFNSSSPALAFQVTSLVDSYMIWVGVTDGRPEDVQSAASRGTLTQDWACAMPSLNVRHIFCCIIGLLLHTVVFKPGNPPVGTSLLRTSHAGVALPMAQRLGIHYLWYPRISLIPTLKLVDSRSRSSFPLIYHQLS